MPTYDYRCKSCGHEFEEFESMSSDPLIMCPKCAKSTLKRLMSGGAGLIFKGSGFYETDYKNSHASLSSGTKPKAKPASKAKSKPDSKPESKSDSQQESKPEPKKESKPSTDTSSSAGKK